MMIRDSFRNDLRHSRFVRRRGRVKTRGQTGKKIVKFWERSIFCTSPITVGEVRVPSRDDGIVHGKLYVAKVDILTLRGTKSHLTWSIRLRIAVCFCGRCKAGMLKKNGPILRRSFTAIVSLRNGAIRLMKGRSFG